MATKDPTIYWVGTSKNRKTGNIPQAFVGETEEECASTCRAVGCHLLPQRLGGPYIPKRDRKKACAGGLTELQKLALDQENSCYSWQGQTARAARSIRKAMDVGMEYYREMFAKGKDRTRAETRLMKEKKRRYTLDEAIDNSVRSARMVRWTAIGDGGMVGKEKADEICKKLDRAGLLLYGFTRSWLLESSQHWMGRVMASCFSLEEADQAIDMGWRASVVLPKGFKDVTFTTPKGRMGVVCPYIQGKRLVCNTCGLCVASKSGPVIGFPSHV